MTKEDSAALHLQGLILEGGWIVGDLVPLPEDHTGSAFSVGYRVHHQDDGRRGFLKAFDFSMAFKHPDMTAEIERLTTLYNGERDLLRWCNEKGLRRVIRSLDDGTAHVPGFELGAVPYVIFEEADQDVRGTLANCDPADQIARLSLAHHAAVALRQLHINSVSHRDVKPSNMVVWADTVGSTNRPQYEGKLSDLGCAHVPGRPSPHDFNPIAGDMSYASPEQLYDCDEFLSDRRHKQAADMFMLGNLIVYLMTGVTHNQLIYRELDETLHWRNWGGSYDEVLPGLVDAHVTALSSLEPLLLDEVKPLLQVIDGLCHPDPNQRGDMIARRQNHNPFTLERFVTRLNLIQQRAELFLRAS
jgi:serine/threonine protein kinase